MSISAASENQVFENFQDDDPPQDSEEPVPFDARAALAPETFNQIVASLQAARAQARDTSVLDRALSAALAEAGFSAIRVGARRRRSDGGNNAGKRQRLNEDGSRTRSKGPQPSAKCRVENCNKYASFGYPGDKKLRCLLHIEEGMVDVKHVRRALEKSRSEQCDVQGCEKHASFGWPNSSRIRCGTHMELGMVDRKQINRDPKAPRKKLGHGCPSHRPIECISQLSQPDMAAEVNTPPSRQEMMEHLVGSTASQAVITRESEEGLDGQDAMMLHQLKEVQYVDQEQYSEYLAAQEQMQLHSQHHHHHLHNHEGTDSHVHQESMDGNLDGSLGDTDVDHNDVEVGEMLPEITSDECIPEGDEEEQWLQPQPSQGVPSNSAVHPQQFSQLMIEQDQYQEQFEQMESQEQHLQQFRASMPEQGLHQPLEQQPHDYQHLHLQHEEQQMQLALPPHQMIFANPRPHLQRGPRANHVCAQPGCKNTGKFNVPGGPRYCEEHRTEGMTYPKCGEEGCMNMPYYANPMEHAPTRCKRHRQAAMVDKRGAHPSHRCNFGGCATIANFNYPGGPGRWCSKHKLEGMVNVKEKRQCAVEGCVVRPYFGYADDERATRCAAHKEPGMIDIRNGKCEVDGCTKLPGYGYPITPGPRARTKWDPPKMTRCSKHRLENMVGLKNPRCEVEACPKQAVYAFQGERARRCTGHRLENMVNPGAPAVCQEPDCGKAAKWGFEKDERATRCKKHKVDGMVAWWLVVKSKKAAARGESSAFRLEMTQGMDSQVESGSLIPQVHHPAKEVAITSTTERLSRESDSTAILEASLELDQQEDGMCASAATEQESLFHSMRIRSLNSAEGHTFVNTSGTQSVPSSISQGDALRVGLETALDMAREAREIPTDMHSVVESIRFETGLGLSGRGEEDTLMGMGMHERQSALIQLQETRLAALDFKVVHMQHASLVPGLSLKHATS